MADPPPSPDAPELSVAEPLPAGPGGQGAHPSTAAVRRTSRACVNLGCAAILVSGLMYVVASRGGGSEPSSILILALLMFTGFGWIFACATWWIDRKLPQRIARKRAIFGLIAPVLALALAIGGMVSARRRAALWDARENGTALWSAVRGLDWSDPTHGMTLSSVVSDGIERNYGDVSPDPAAIFDAARFDGEPGAFDVSDVKLGTRSKRATLTLRHRVTGKTVELTLRRSGGDWHFTDQPEVDGD